MDWVKWHEGYDVSPSLSARLQLVCAHIVSCLDACPPGLIHIISVCAGDGRDLIGALTNHPCKGDVVARLVEREQQLIEQGQQAAEAVGLSRQLEFVCADATMSSAYQGIAPANVVLLCGVLGNVHETAIPCLLKSLTALCQRGGCVVWTHHRSQHGGLAKIRELFGQAAFEEVCFEVTPEGDYGVGTHRHCAEAVVLPEGQQLFAFSGFDRLPDRRKRKWLHKSKR